jgi:hypothetical protein
MRHEAERAEADDRAVEVCVATTKPLGRAVCGYELER